MRRRSRAVCALAALLLAGCVTERRKTLVMIPEGALAPHGEDEAPAPRRGRARRAREEVSFDGAQDVPPESRVPQPLVAVAAALPAPADAGPAHDVAGPYAGHRPLEAGVSLEQALREKFLNAATTVEAEKATLYVPPALAAQARLTGAHVAEEAPGRRVATGSAMLVLRRLTVRAARLTLVARADGTPDVSLHARGRVRFHADLPASVIEERDLKSLILRNDGFTPLR